MNALELRRALDQVVQGVTEGNLGILDEGVSAMEAGIKQQQGIIEALVAACEAMLADIEECENHPWRIPGDEEAVEQLRAAIAKARGEVRS